jgi:hypothetical protein
VRTVLAEDTGEALSGVGSPAQRARRIVATAGWISGGTAPSATSTDATTTSGFLFQYPTEFTAEAPAFLD